MENGQFFTPPHLCELVVNCLNPTADDFVADLTCGMGGFFNFLPVETNAYGCEIDVKAYKVETTLFPNVRIENKDIRVYQPDILCDYVVGNPPYNLRWWTEDGAEILSQLFYCFKAYDLLKPFGILAIITPMSFLADAFTDGGQIKEMEQRFHFLGQVQLPRDSFLHLGIAVFPVKLQFWQKKGSTEEDRKAPYDPAISLVLQAGFQKAAAEIISNRLLQNAKDLLVKNRGHIMLELAKTKEVSAEFQYRVNKMLYQIKIHPRLREKTYPRCCEYLHRFYTQTQPPEMEYEEWCKKRLTEAKVLSYFKRALSRRNAPPPRDKVKFIKRNYDFVYKGYSKRARQQMTPAMKQPIPIYYAASTDGTEDYPGFERLVAQKQQAYAIQSQNFSGMEEDPKIAQWLPALHL